MKLSNSFRLALGMMVASILACNIGAPGTPEPEDPVTTGNTPPAVAAPTDPPSSDTNCTNPYLPVVVGATWEYNLTGPIPDTYTHSIVSATESGFIEQDVFASGVTRQAEWKCEDGNIIALNAPGGGNASVSAEGVEVEFETKQISGVTLPAIINPGDTWSQSLVLEGTQTINGTSYPAGNSLTSDCTAVGLESVTVPAGTFDAMRMDCTTTMNLSMTMDGNEIKNTIVLKGSNWYAPNVGLVRQASTGSGLDSTIELLSFNIP